MPGAKLPGAKLPGAKLPGVLLLLGKVGGLVELETLPLRGVERLQGKRVQRRRLMDKVNEKVDTDCSKQDNGNDVELSMEVMVVDVEKQDSNMLILTKLFCQPVVDRRGGRRHGEERTGRTRSGRGGRQLLGVGGVGDEKVGGVGDEKVGGGGSWR